jgi:hypothetical protein
MSVASWPEPVDPNGVMPSDKVLRTFLRWRREANPTEAAQ